MRFTSQLAIILIVLWNGAYWLLFRRVPPADKNRRYPIFLAASAGISTACLYLLVSSRFATQFGLPAAAIGTAYQLLVTRFCPGCGARYGNFGRIFRQNYCRKCGHQLHEHKGEVV